jgi:hypothetical protein
VKNFVIITPPTQKYRKELGHPFQISEPSGPPSELPDVMCRREEEGGKKKWNSLRTLLPTTNNKCNSTQEECHVTSPLSLHMDHIHCSRNSRKVDCVPVTPWVAVIKSVRFRVVCVYAPLHFSSIEFQIEEQKRGWEICLYRDCLIPPSIVSVLLPLMFLKCKTKKMTS